MKLQQECSQEAGAEISDVANLFALASCKCQIVEPHDLQPLK